jgi:hypothetical protein
MHWANAIVLFKGSGKSSWRRKATLYGNIRYWMAGKFQETGTFFETDPISKMVDGYSGYCNKYSVEVKWREKRNRGEFL